MKLLVKSSWWRSLVTRKRVRTIDRAAGDFHTPLQLGPKRRMTPEGFLLCEDVPIGRTGELLYAAGEVPVEPDRRGLITITRDAAALFHPDTIASFNGKPVTDNHPPGMEVSPDNYLMYGKGFTVNARRGEGEYSDCIVADLLIMDKHTIAKIIAGKVEVSSGYKADYEDNGGGFGRQIAILGNHVALVDKGRCGPRCAIGDHDTTEGEEEMPTPNAKPANKGQRAQLLAHALKAALTADEAGELADQLAGDNAGDPVDGATHIHFHSSGATLSPTGADGGAASKTGTTTGDERMDKLEKIVGDMGTTLKTVGDSVAELMKKFGGPGGDSAATTEEDGKKTGDEGSGEDDKSKTGDSAALATSYAKLAQDCEILVPGFKPPTLDTKAKRSATVDSMCAIRRNALGHFAMAPGAAQVIQAASGDAQFNVATADCATVAEVFSASVMAKRMANNQAATGDAAKIPALLKPVGVSSSGAPASLSPADLNKQYSDFWAKQNRMN